MSARQIRVSVDLLDRATGEVAVFVDDLDNPEPDCRQQEMLLHPAAVTVLRELLAHYAVHGVSVEETLNLNAPDSAVTP